MRTPARLRTHSPAPLRRCALLYLPAQQPQKHVFKHSYLRMKMFMCTPGANMAIDQIIQRVMYLVHRDCRSERELMQVHVALDMCGREFLTLGSHRPNVATQTGSQPPLRVFHASLTSIKRGAEMHSGIAHHSRFQNTIVFTWPSSFRVAKFGRGLPISIPFIIYLATSPPICPPSSRCVRSCQTPL
eukprot:6178483-Pleurochrysis_carterae.AAC.1